MDRALRDGVEDWDFQITPGERRSLETDWTVGFQFNLLQNMVDFPLLVLKGTYHYWRYAVFFFLQGS